MDRYPKAEATAATRVGGRAATLAYAAQTALLASVVVWSPAAGALHLTILFAGAACALLALVEVTRARSRPGSPAASARTRVTALVSLVVVFLAAVTASSASVLAGHGEWSLALAITAFPLLVVGAWAGEWKGRDAPA
jgi:hypothetical protein